MLDRARGHIVVLSSAAGLRSFPWGAVYGGTKAFDRGFAEALRHELVRDRRLAHDGVPGRVRDHRSSPTSATGCRTGAANDEERPVEELVAAIVAGVEADTRAVVRPTGSCASWA